MSIPSARSAAPHPNRPTIAQSAANQPKILRFTREDFEKTIDCLPRRKQELARGLFSTEPGSRSRFMTADETRLKAFVQTLKPEELKILTKIAQMNQMYMRPERPPATIAVPKDTGRFTPVPAPQARRPAQGADLSPPPTFQGSRPQSMDQDLYPEHSGKARGKPNSESAKPKRETLAELFEAERPSQDPHFSLQNQTQPVPPKGILKKEPEAGTAQEKPNSEAAKPNRLRFADKLEEVHNYEPDTDTMPLRQPSPTPQGNGRIKNFFDSFTRKEKVLLGVAATAATLGGVGIATGAILNSKDDSSSSNASDKT